MAGAAMVVSVRMRPTAVTAGSAVTGVLPVAVLLGVMALVVMPLTATGPLGWMAVPVVVVVMPVLVVAAG